MVVPLHESGDGILLYARRVNRTGTARWPGYVFEQTQLALQLTVYTLQFAIGLRVSNSAQYVLYAQALQVSFKLGRPLALLFRLGGVELAATVTQYGFWLAVFGYGLVQHFYGVFSCGFIKYAPPVTYLDASSS